MPWLFWVGLAIWLVGAIYSWIYGGRKLAVITFLLGAAAVALVWYLGASPWISVGAVMVLAAITWIVSTAGFTQDV